MRFFLGSHGKINHFLLLPPASSDTGYESWSRSNIVVVTMLLNCMEANIISSVMFYNTSKAIQNSLATTYEPQQNINHIYQLYEGIFSTRQDGRLLHEYYTQLTGKWDELLQYHPSSSSYKNVSCSLAARKLHSGHSQWLNSYQDWMRTSLLLETCYQWNPLFQLFKMASQDCFIYLWPPPPLSLEAHFQPHGRMVGLELLAHLVDRVIVVSLMLVLTVAKLTISFIVVGPSLEDCLVQELQLVQLR